MLTWLTRDSLAFPPPQTALREPNGLLAAGGDLSPERLIAAYRHGCFPWFEEGQPILWWHPDPRTVLFPAQLHVSRSLAKTLRKTPYRVTFDQAFGEILAGCAAPRAYTDGTWITSRMRQAYQQLHERGIAHSVEVWLGDELVGGLYGLAIGRVFFGESMFARADNASKVGFVTLVQHLQGWGFELIDCQMPTQHLHSLGAEPISREAFLALLACHRDTPSEADWQVRTDGGAKHD